MPKRQLTLYIDTHLIEIMKVKGINMSKLVEDLFQQIANQSKNPSDLQLDENKINLKIANLTNEINELKAQLPLIEEKKFGGKILKTSTVDTDDY